MEGVYTVNSRDKGKRGERAWAAFLKEQGFHAWRGAQHAGRGVTGGAAPDVVCPDLPGIHWEVKFTQAFRLWDALVQAISDALPGQKPVVAHRKNHGDWVVVMRADDFFDILRDSEEVNQQEREEKEK